MSDRMKEIPRFGAKEAYPDKPKITAKPVDGTKLEEAIGRGHFRDRLDGCHKTLGKQSNILQTLKTGMKKPDNRVFY